MKILFNQQSGKKQKREELTRLAKWIIYYLFIFYLFFKMMMMIFFFAFALASSFDSMFLVADDLFRSCVSFSCSFHDEKKNFIMKCSRLVYHFFFHYFRFNLLGWIICMYLTFDDDVVVDEEHIILIVFLFFLNLLQTFKMYNYLDLMEYKSLLYV
jgi:hypothetical protein